MKRILAAEIVAAANELYNEKQFDLSKKLFKVAAGMVPDGFSDQDFNDLPGELNDPENNYTGQLDFYKKEILKDISKVASALQYVEAFVNEEHNDKKTFFDAITMIEELAVLLSDFANEYVDNSQLPND